MNKNKSGSGYNTLLIVMLVTIVGALFIVFKDNPSIKFNFEGIGIFESKELQRSDFEIRLESGKWTSVYIIITPKRDIDNINLAIFYYDKNNLVVKRDSHTSNNLSKNREYKIEMKNEFFETLNFAKWEVEFVSGTRK